MPLQGLILLIFMFLIIPLLMLSTNQYIFFVVTAIILIIVSIKNIYKRLLNITEDEEDPENEDIEELEDMFGLNMKKFGTGINVVRSLFLILFYFYCSFNLNAIALRIPAAFLIIVQVHEIRTNLKQNKKVKLTTIPNRVFKITTSVLSLVLIISTGYILLF